MATELLLFQATFGPEKFVQLLVQLFGKPVWASSTQSFHVFIWKTTQTSKDIRVGHLGSTFQIS